MENTANQLAELTKQNREILYKIDQLLYPPKPKFVNLKTACVMLDRTYAVVLRYVKDLKIEAVVSGKSKSYRIEDIEKIADRIGVTLKNVK